MYIKIIIVIYRRGNFLQFWVSKNGNLDTFFMEFIIFQFYPCLILMNTKAPHSRHSTRATIGKLSSILSDE